MISLRKSLFLSMFEKYSNLIIQFATSMIVARLLTPEQFGVFAVAFAIVSFAQVIREMGVNSYIVQRRELGPNDIRACLFLTCSVAWSLALLLFIAAPLVERLYGGDVRKAVIILLVNLLILPISSTIFAVLQREMRFDLLLRINIVGALSNSVCAVALAAAGWGYLSLAWACVAGQLASALVAALCRPQLQHFLPSYVGASNVLHFGIVIMLGSLLSQVSTNVANLITAKFVTLEAMGLFTRSQSVSGLFSRLIMDGVHPLMLPLFAAMRRTDADVGPFFEQTVSFLAVVSWPFFCFLAVCAEPLIIVMFGDQWYEAAYLLQLISIAGLFWIIQPVANPMLVALGRVNVILRIQIINQAIALFGVVVAAMQGIEAVAMAAIPISAAHACLWMYHAGAVTHVRARALFRAGCVSAMVTAASLMAPVVVMTLLEDRGHLEKLMLAAAGSAIGWIVAVFVCRHPISAEISRLGLRVKEAAGRRARA